MVLNHWIKTCKESLMQKMLFEKQIKGVITNIDDLQNRLSYIV